MTRDEETSDFGAPNNGFASSGVRTQNEIRPSVCGYQKSPRGVRTETSPGAYDDWVNKADFTHPKDDRVKTNPKPNHKKVFSPRSLGMSRRLDVSIRGDFSVSADSGVSEASLVTAKLERRRVVRIWAKSQVTGRAGKQP